MGAARAVGDQLELGVGEPRHHRIGAICCPPGGQTSDDLVKASERAYCATRSGSGAVAVNVSRGAITTATAANAAITRKAMSG